MKNLDCFRFECRLCRLFERRIAESKDQRYFFHITVNDFDRPDDLDILAKTFALKRKFFNNS